MHSVIDPIEVNRLLRWEVLPTVWLDKRIIHILY